MMGSIYSSAVTVVVWLGQPDTHSEVTYKLMQQIVPALQPFLRKADLGELKNNPENPSFWDKVGRPPVTIEEQKALIHFFDRHWYERAWIIQEVIFARSIFCICGAQEFRWDFVHSMSLYLYHSGWTQRLSRVKAQAKSQHESAPAGFKPMSLHGLTLQCANGLPISAREILPPATQLALVDLEPTFYRVLEHIIHFTRGSKASLPHDMLYAPAAIALQLFSQTQMPDLLHISYTKSVAEAYTHISGLIVQYTRQLSLLAHVEDRSVRQQDCLPSWVPDFSVPVVQSLDWVPDHSFNCIAGLNAVCEPRIQDTGLATLGIQFDVITQAGLSRAGDGIEKSPSPWLQFYLELDRIYPTGEPSIEAFVRTFIADQRGSKSGEELTVQFRAYLLRLCADSRNMQEVMESVAGNRDRPTWSALEAFNVKGRSRGIPSLDEVLSLHSAQDSDTDSVMHAFNTLSRRFFETGHFRVMLGRRMFRSRKDFIGLCPLSAREGEAIWIMAGSMLPFVLRKTTEKGVYKFLGAAYVHGIMYGGFFKNGHEELETVTLR
jgi:hypothetical protein